MDAKHVHRIPVGSSLLAEALLLHKRYKSTLGFLPRQGFIERAAAGTLIGCCDSKGTLLGYALYDLPRNHVRLVHLAVTARARGRGVARSLIDWISTEHASRLGIRVSCRRDFPADAMWPRWNFVPIGERPGRGRDASTLTIWWLSFGHPTLFTEPLGEAQIAAIDMNVFLDLITHRSEGRTSLALQDALISDEIELAITDEVFIEINKGDDPVQRASLREQAAAFQRLSPPAPRWNEIYYELERSAQRPMRRRDEPDLRHVAQAIAGGAAFLVTRDRDLTRRWGRLADQLRTRILAPHELAQLLDQQRRQAVYAPAKLEETDIEIRRLRASEVDATLDFMTVQASGERGRDLRRVLQDLLAQTGRVDLWVLTESSKHLAVWSERILGSDLTVELFRVNQSTLAHTLARHLLFRLKNLALDQKLSKVEIADERISSPVATALRDEYFELSGGDPARWTYWPIRFIGPLKRFQTRIVQDNIAMPTWLKRPSELGDVRGMEVERRYWPAKIVDAPLETFMVPIKPFFAEELFDVDLARETLFYRRRDLGLSREHVYYRSPRGSAGIAAPARIVWYVTSKKNAAGTSAVVACSRLDEVVLGPADILYQRFRHLGVYSRSEVRARAAGGLVMALRFTDTQRFPHRVDLKKLNAIAKSEGKRGLFTQGPWRVSDSFFEKVFTAGVCE